MYLEEVTRTQFFQYVGPRDIVTRAEGDGNAPGGYTTVFETRARQLVGTISGPEPRTYKLTREAAATL